jgi:hypothetical protein
MVAPAQRTPRRRSVPRWHRRFLAMLPLIQRQARVAFRDLPPQAREDAVAEVVANCLVSYVRLVRRGREQRAFPSVLAKYAIRQFRDHRRVGVRLCIRDVLSPYAQQRKRFTVERLDRFDNQEGAWLEAVVQDTRHTSVLEVAAFRIDFAEWLRRLPARHRRLAQYLAAGHRASEAARKLGVCDARISQVRGELCRSWREFQGEKVA